MATSKNFFKNNLENLESTSEFSRVLVVFTHSMLNSVANLLQQHWCKSIFFPVTFILGLFANLFMAIKFIKLENKNLGNSANLILSIVTTVLTLITTVLFFISGYPLIVGVCMLTAMSIGAIFNISLFIFNTYKFIRLSDIEKNNHLKTIYTANCFKYGVATLVGIITLSSFIASVFFFPYLASGIVIGLGILSGIVVLAGGFYKLFNFFKSSITRDQKFSNDFPVVESTSVPSESELMLDSLQQPIISEPKKSNNTFRYYESEHRSQQLDRDLTKNREFLLKQILEKINLLEKKIENDKGKVGEFLWMQEEKRIEKIDLLINLVIFLLPTNEKLAENTIENIETKIPISTLSYEKIMVQFHHLNFVKKNDKTGWKTYEEFYQFFNNYHANKAFQSFFKNISDVKDLYDAVTHHFEIEKFLNLENAQKKLQVEREKIQAALHEKDPEITKKLENFQFTPYIYSEKLAEEHY